jgi:Flp pilus assembly protein TadG
MIFPAKQKGVAAIEFAILVPLMMLMVFGITEFGRAFYQYNTLTKSVRDGVRYLSTQAPSTGHGIAVCLAVYGNQSCTGQVLVPGLSTSMVSICDAINCPGTHSAVSTGSGVVNLATVSITGFPFTSLVNFNLAGLTIGAPNMTFGPVSATMRQIL